MAPNRKSQQVAAATLAISAMSLMLAALAVPLGAEAQQAGAVKGSAASRQQRPPRPAPASYAAPQQRPTGSKSKPAAAAVESQQQQQQQQVDTHSDYYNEDPLADSEPALYGSVAGKPGLDFPAYTRIPKTSFTCEGKGHDFGFYADPEAQCQVYHVCWSGRHEAFLCGVGTVFNQAILACDYWHSVDCSKSAAFYNVNSELGKASSEPAAQQQQTSSTRAKQQAPLPAPPASTSSALAASSQPFGEPLSKQRQPQPAVYQSAGKQRASLSTGTTVNQQPPPQTSRQLNENSFNSFLDDGFGKPAPSQQQSSTGAEPAPTKSHHAAPSRPQASGLSQLHHQVRDQRPASSSPPPPPPVASKRARFNPDFNQKVNSLIEAPVRAPLKSTGSSQRRPAAPKRSNQSPWAAARKPVAPVQQQQPLPAIAQQQEPASQQQQQQQQLPNYEPELDEPQQQQQQQQQSFDDSPVQTSTLQSAYLDRLTPPNKGPNKQQVEQQQQQQQQQVFASDGSSSAVTSQFDTLAGDGAYGDSPAAAPEEANDDFRSAGAKAAASHNQNWYIMRTV